MECAGSQKISFFERDYPEKTNWKREAMSIALWISLNLADLVVTKITMIIAMDGGFVEGNPAAAWIGENIVG